MAARKELSKQTETPFELGRRINVSVTKTVNTGNYESIKIGAMLSENIKDDADLDVEYSRMFDEVSMQVLAYQKDVMSPGDD